MDDFHDDLILKYIDDISSGFFVSPNTSAHKIDKVEELFYDELVSKFLEFKGELIVNKENEIAIIKHKLDICLAEKNDLNAEIIKRHDQDHIKLLLHDKRVGLIGGAPNRVIKIKQYLSSQFSCNSFKETPPDSAIDLSDFLNKYQSCHVLIVNTDYIGHSLSDLAKKASDKYNIPIIEHDHDFMNHIGQEIIKFFVQ